MIRFHLQYDTLQPHNQLFHLREGGESSWGVGTFLITLRDYQTIPYVRQLQPAVRTQPEVEKQGKKNSH